MAIRAGAQGIGFAIPADTMVKVASELLARQSKVTPAHLGLALRETGVDRVHFAWAGPIDPRQPHYYRLHGPTLLIEYDNSQNQANHVHSVWHDPRNDFGADPLRAHYERRHHRGAVGS